MMKKRTRKEIKVAKSAYQLVDALVPAEKVAAA
jgi:hypothetical protein